MGGSRDTKDNPILQLNGTINTIYNDDPLWWWCAWPIVCNGRDRSGVSFCIMACNVFVFIRYNNGGLHEQEDKTLKKRKQRGTVLKRN